MIAFIIFLFCVFAALGTGVLSAYSDYKGLTIPNAYSAVILGLFPLCYAALFVLGNVQIFQSLGSHILALLFVFAVSAALFSFRVMGAADSKLASAMAVWVGWKGMFAFLFYMALFGAVLAVISLIVRKKKPFKNPPAGGWIDVVQNGGNKLPYGIAIVIGGIIAFCQLGYLDFGVLVSVFDL